MPEKKKETLGKSIFDILEFFLKCLLAVFLFITFFCRQVTVDGSSMNDTLQNNDRLAVWTFMYEPRPKDIVVITHGAKLDTMLIKRVIAVGGQRLTINYDSGEVFVDGVLLYEDYIKGHTIKLSMPVKNTDLIIPEGYVFVMGDNRENSTDSRSALVDIIPVQNIIGKAFCRLAPLPRFGTI